MYTEQEKAELKALLDTERRHIIEADNMQVELKSYEISRERRAKLEHESKVLYLKALDCKFERLFMVTTITGQNLIKAFSNGKTDVPNNS